MGRQTTLHLLALVLFCFSLSGCALTNKFGPYHGKVIDAETGEPLEGAVVFMKVITMTGTVAGTTSHYADFKEVLTDDKGHFYLELRSTVLRPGHVWDYDPFIMVFKPGYGVYPSRGASAGPYIYGTSKFPPNKEITVRLPRLETIKEREDNIMKFDISWYDKTPIDKKKHAIRLLREEFDYINNKSLLKK